MRIRGHGMALDPPARWEVRIGQRTSDDQQSAALPRTVLHAATVALGEVRGDFGGDITDRLRPEGVFVSVFEYGPEAVGSPLFSPRGRPTLRVVDFSPAGLQRSISGQSGRQYFFQESGRALCLYVVLGSHARRASLLNEVRTVLDTLTVDTAGV